MSSHKDLLESTPCQNSASPATPLGMAKANTPVALSRVVIVVGWIFCILWTK